MTPKQLADISRVSVRTLHHYDEIGLLSPKRQTGNDYREYTDDDLMQLQQILFFRELEFPLEEIKRIIHAPDFSQTQALIEHKHVLQKKQQRMHKLIQTIDKTLHYMQSQQNPPAAELYDAFQDDDIKEHQAEAQQRWGNTEAYRESMKKVGKMTRVEMEKVKREGKILTQKLADSMDKDISDPEVQLLVNQHFAGVNFFYACSLEMYRNLAKMYVEDPRFKAHYDEFRPGLADWLQQAINFYIDEKTKK